MYYTTFLEIFYKLIPNTDICIYIYNILNNIEYNDNLNYWNNLNRYGYQYGKCKFSLLIKLINSNCIKYINADLYDITLKQCNIYSIPYGLSILYDGKYRNITDNINIIENNTFRYKGKLYYMNLSKTICYRKRYHKKQTYTFGYRKLLYKSTNEYHNIKSNIFTIDQLPHNAIIETCPFKMKIEIINLFYKYNELKSLYKNYILDIHELFIDSNNYIYCKKRSMIE